MGGWGTEPIRLAPPFGSAGGRGWQLQPAHPEGLFEPTGEYDAERHAVPAVLRLTNNARGELRMATNRSLHMLYRSMGDDLVQAIRAAHIPSAAKDQALTSLGVL